MKISTCSLLLVFIGLTVSSLIAFMPEYDTVSLLVKLELVEEQEEIQLGHYNPDSVMRTLNSYIAKDPEIMYVDNYSYSWVDGVLRVNYRIKATEHIKILREEVKKLGADIKTKYESDYDRIKAINDLICSKTIYDKNAAKEIAKGGYTDIPTGMEDVSTAYGVLIEGKGICQGYSAATSMLLTEVGIDNFIQIGLLRGIPHSWVKVKVGNEYYNLDTTSNDSNTPYAVLLSADASMREYTFSSNVESDTQENYNYFKRNGSYAKTESEFKAILKERYLQGFRQISIKTSPELHIDNKKVLLDIKSDIHFRTVDYGEFASVSYFKFQE